MSAAMPSPPDAFPFFVGFPRSGTTPLRAMFVIAGAPDASGTSELFGAGRSFALPRESGSLRVGQKETIA
jgi:hypothetical protein